MNCRNVLLDGLYHNFRFNKLAKIKPQASLLWDINKVMA